MSTQRPQRLLRISRACDFCHKRRIKCQDNSGGTGRCRNCTEFDIPCTYARPSRRGRGSPQPSRPNLNHATSSGSGDVSVSSPTQPQLLQQQLPHHPAHHQQQQHPNQAQHPLTTYGRSLLGTSNSSRFTDDSSTGDQLSSTWQGFAHASTPVLKRLLKVYHDAVYPIFPFFDPVRVERRLDTLEHVRNRAFFCSVMAACALAAARARDGALFSGISTSGGSKAGSQVAGDIPPEIFLIAAEESLPRDNLQAQDFDYLRGYALLAVASIQDAKIASMHKYIGLYFTMVAINQWHDEANWPGGLHPTEIEERRRVYWSIYTLDVYSSIIWDGCIHFQESHARVEYPTGASEDEVGGSDSGGVRNSISSTEDPKTPTPATSPTAARAIRDSQQQAHWIIGWNFTTDLYRILEHNLSKLRSRNSRFNLLGETTTPGSFRVSSQDRVSELYTALPPIFKQLQPATGQPTQDIYGFQAANIQATMALLEMVHLSLEVNVGLEQKCTVVNNVLTIFHQVPKSYMRCISTPLIYHIGGIGVILGSVMEGPLSETSYRTVRGLLLSMAVLLESLEAFLARSAGAGQRLRHLVSRIEEYISQQNKTAGGQDGSIAAGNIPSTGINMAEIDGSYNTGRPENRRSYSTNSESGAESAGSIPVATPTLTNASASNIQAHDFQTHQQHLYQPQALLSAGQPNYTVGNGGRASLSGSSTVSPSGSPMAARSSSMSMSMSNTSRPGANVVSSAPRALAQVGAGNSGVVSPQGVTSAAAAAASVVMSPVGSQVGNQVGNQVGSMNNVAGRMGNSMAAYQDGTIAPPVPWDDGSGAAAAAASAAGISGMTPEMQQQAQFQLPDEFLQDWTWPFSVSNSYLSF